MVEVGRKAAPRSLPLAVPWGRVTFLGLALLLVLFLALPLVAIILQAIPAGPQAWLDPATLDALRLSLWTASLSAGLAVAVGTPVAYLLAREEFRGKTIIDTLVDLPMILPPAVAGIALLMAFGRRGLLGPALSSIGIELPFTTAAVVMAETFVAAPFYVRRPRPVLLRSIGDWSRCRRCLGVSNLRTFFRVTLPLPGRRSLGAC